MPLFQKTLRLFIFSLFYAVPLLAQLPKGGAGDPLFFIDGKEVLKSEMGNINSNDIATVTVLKEGAFKKYGEKGKNGVVLIETKAYSRKRFQQYFSAKSPSYKTLLELNSNDQNIQYILNEKVLKNDYEGDLASIADSTLISVDVIDAGELKKYKVTDKQHGLLIKTKDKSEPQQQKVEQSKFEPELLILSVKKISFDPAAAKYIENQNKKLKQEISSHELTEPSDIKEENFRLMAKSTINYAKKLDFFKQISINSQNYLTYRFIERFPNTLILIKDTTAGNDLTDLAKIAKDENMPYILSFPSAHMAKEKEGFVLHLKVQLYEAESNSFLLDKEYKGDQLNRGFEFSCDGSIQCTINNALSVALTDVIKQIALNNKTLQAGNVLAEKRADLIKKEIFLKNMDLSLIKSVIPEADRTVDFQDLYQSFYNDDKTKFVGFFFRRVGPQGLKDLSENKKDLQVKILSGATIKDKNFLSVPQNYAYIVKGVSDKGKWYYKKDMATYFEASDENEGRLIYLNNLQGWGYFKEGTSVTDPDFWEGELFEKIEDKRKNPDWEKYREIWEEEELDNRNYIGMYRLVADQMKEERKAAEDNFKDSVANHVFKPFYEASIRSGLYQIAGYNSIFKDFPMIYAADKKVIINPMEIKDNRGVISVRYFVFLKDSGKIYEWTYFPPFKKKKGSFENGIMENLGTITKWNYSYRTLEDEQFWSKYVLARENGAFKYLK
ncbi:hypothetical protein [Pedobacter nutrimenti]|nr:hypothetical protein [Pedobacter nutrimenti]